MVLCSLKKHCYIEGGQSSSEFGHWRASQTNILRFGVCELLYFSSVPPKVVINEAVEVAKKYGNEESPDFINGVLDKI